MKCKVCGFQFESDRSYCPMCGARVSEAAITPEELQWNTKDFPRPKEVEDIPMRWSSPDATEGYFSMPSSKEKKEAEEAKINAQRKAEEEQARALKEAEAKAEEAARLAAEAEAKAKEEAEKLAAKEKEEAAAKASVDQFFAELEKYTASETPVQKNINAPVAVKEDTQEEMAVAPVVPSFEQRNTFSDDKNEFQRQMDREFERLRDNKPQEEPAVPRKSFNAPSGFGPAFETAKTKASSSFTIRNTGAFIDLPNHNVAPKSIPNTSRQDRFDIDAIEDTIEEIVAAEAKAQAESSERQRKLTAMAAAREAYFKSLDDGEFGKVQNKKNPKYDPNQQGLYDLQSATPIRMQPQAAITMPQRAYERPMAEPVIEKPVFKYSEPTPETPILTDLIGKLDEDKDHTLKFDKQDFVAATEKYVVEDPEIEKRRLEQEQAAAELARLKKEIAEAEQKRKEQEAADIERKRLEEEAAEKERLRLAEEAAEQERKRLEEEAAEKERKRLEEEAAEKERLRIAEEEAQKERDRIAAEKAKREQDRQAQEDSWLAALKYVEDEAMIESKQQAAYDEVLQADFQAEADSKQAEENAKAEADKKFLDEAIQKARSEAEEQAKQEAAAKVAELEAQIQAKFNEEAARKAAEAQAEFEAQKAKLEEEREMIIANARKRLDEERSARIAAENQLKAQKEAAEQKAEMAAKLAEEISPKNGSEKPAEEISSKNTLEKPVEHISPKSLADKLADEISLKAPEEKIVSPAPVKDLGKEKDNLDNVLNPNLLAAKIDAKQAEVVEEKKQEEPKPEKEQIKFNNKQSDLGGLFKSPGASASKDIQDEILAALQAGNEKSKNHSEEENADEMFNKKPVEDHPLYTLKTEADSATKESSKEGLTLNQVVSERKTDKPEKSDTQKVEAISFASSAPAKHYASDIDSLYGDDEDEDDGKHGKNRGKGEKKPHVIRTILLTVIILVGVIELAIFLLGKFMPDDSLVKTIIEINQAVIETVVSYSKIAWEAIVEWVQGAVSRVQEIFKGK